MAKQTGKRPGSNQDGLQGEKLASKTGRPDAKEPTSIIATGNNDKPAEGTFSEGGVGVRIKGGGGDGGK
jgi:hypothetical protein